MSCYLPVSGELPQSDSDSSENKKIAGLAHWAMLNNQNKYKYLEFIHFCFKTYNFVFNLEIAWLAQQPYKYKLSDNVVESLRY